MHLINIQFSPFFLFMTALAIDTQLSKGANSLLLGVALVAINLVVVALVFAMAMHKHRREEAEGLWRRGLNERQLAIVDAVMQDGANDGANDATTDEKPTVETSKSNAAPAATMTPQQLLKQHLLRPEDVKMVATFPRLFRS